MTNGRQWAAVTAASLLFIAWVLLMGTPRSSLATVVPRGGLVVVDAGHGGPDPGAVAATGAEEQAVNLAVAKQVARELMARGVATRLTRYQDAATTGRGPKQDLEARASYANHWGATLLVSIHVNTEPTGTVEGPIVYYRAGSALSLLLAEDIESALARASGRPHPPRPAHHRLLLRANMPAVTVELGFFSASAEMHRLLTPAWQARLAQAITAGVLKYLNRGA